MRVVICKCPRCFPERRHPKVAMEREREREQGQVSVCFVKEALTPPTLCHARPRRARSTKGFWKSYNSQLPKIKLHISNEHCELCLGTAGYICVLHSGLSIRSTTQRGPTTAECILFPLSLSRAEGEIKVCMSCYAGPMQGQAEQLSKSKKKFLATTYKPLFPPLYNCRPTYNRSSLNLKSEDRIDL